MQKIPPLISLLLLLLFACKDETESLKNEIQQLQSIVALQNAFSAHKIIVSVTEIDVEKTAYWNITFSDNTTLQLPSDVVESIHMREATDDCIIILTNGQHYVFSLRDIIYPTGLVLLTHDIKYMKNAEVPIEFRVNPSNAIFNYNVHSTDCQLVLDMTDRVTIRSYTTEPEQCRLTRIEQAKDAQGKAKEGQYIAYVADNGGYYGYQYHVALVLSSKDQRGAAIQLSSSAISLERKKDTRLPIVSIHTENKAEILDKINWVNASIKIDGAGVFPHYEGTTSIRGRGNSSWGFPKKPYNLKLDFESELLGMPSHRHWVLLANYIDRTLIRNHIAFEIARRTGLEWTVRGQFVEVVLNDIHIGNYYLCEKVKPGENRVNITGMGPDDLDDESITGGYLLEYDSYFDEINQFRTETYDYPVMIQEPDETVLQPEQFEYIQQYIDTFEQLLNEPDFATTRAYASLIADTTFIDWWFVMELTCNYEARYPKSCFFYKDRLDVLKAGPVWDLDWGTFTSQRVSGFYAKESLYYAQLFKDPVFVRKVRERWAMFKPLFEEITEVIKSDGLPLHNSAELNDAMWSLKNFTNINEDNAFAFDDAIQRMSNTYANRLRWLDGQITSMR